MPSTPYVIVVQTYSLWSLLQLDALEETYNRTLTDFQDDIARGHGGSTPAWFSVSYSPVHLVWRADVIMGGLNYSMLSIVFGALQRLHTDPQPSLRNVFRKMIYYYIFEQIGPQRFELGEGQVDSIQAISKRQSVSPLNRNHAYQIPSTPYNLLVSAYSDDPVMPITPLQEVYSIVISAVVDEIAQGRGAATPIDLTFREPPVAFSWTRSNEGAGLNNTDLLKVFEVLESIHMNRETPWHSRRIWYNIAVPNAEQGLIALGGGWVDDMPETGPSNVSVQNSKRTSVDPVNPFPSYVCHIPNTPYIIEIRAVPPSVPPQWPGDPLKAIYDLAFLRFDREIRNGHGDDVPSTVNIVVGSLSLIWRRQDPPGLNYYKLVSVYQLLERLQRSGATPFPQGYRLSLFFRVITIEDDVLGTGEVSCSELVEGQCLMALSPAANSSSAGELGK